MITDAQENALREIVADRLAITTIWEQQTTATGAPVPRPALPFALLNVVSDVAEGLPAGRGDAVLSGGQYLEQVVEDRTTRVSVRVRGTVARSKISDLRLYLQTETARGLLSAAGLGLLTVGTATDLTDLVGAGWEAQVGVDLVLHYQASLAIDEGYLETVRIGVTYKDGATTVATDTIEATT